jgi:hypothetical protein
MKHDDENQLKFACNYYIHIQGSQPLDATTKHSKFNNCGIKCKVIQYIHTHTPNKRSIQLYLEFS